MNKLIHTIIISEKLISKEQDQDKIDEAKDILSNLSFDEVLQLINIKSRMVTDIDNKYKKDMKRLKKSSKYQLEELNETALDFYLKRKEIEYRFLDRILKMKK